MFDFEKAFTYIKNDTQWIKKFVIGSLIMLPATLLSSIIRMFSDNPKALSQYGVLYACGIIIVVIASAIVSGYYYKLLNNRIKAPSLELPGWCMKEIGNYIFLSIKAFIGYCLLYAPFIILMLLILMWMGFLKTTGSALFLLPLILLVPLFIIMILTSSLMTLSFAYDFKILSFYNFKRGGLILKNNILNFFILLVVIVALSAIYQTVSALLTLTVIGIVLIPFIGFYISYVFADMGGQLVRKSQLINDNNEEKGE